MTAAVLGIGIERTHLQQPRCPQLRHRAQQAGGEFHVRTAKSGAAEAALVEDADQVDDDVAAVDAAV